jgi:predicted RNA-binding Zn ribbon-like protein
MTLYDREDRIECEDCDTWAEHKWHEKASEFEDKLLEAQSKLDEQVRLREMAESFLRTAIEINEKNTSRLDAALEHLQKGVAMLDHFARIGYVHNEKTLDWAREANNLSAVERQLPECRNCGTPSSVLTNGWCDGCMGMARV